jgi:hypothetical protein
MAKNITLTAEQLDKLIAQGVEKALTAASLVKHVVTQDQHDLLSVIAPDKLVRHDYTVNG